MFINSLRKKCRNLIFVNIFYSFFYTPSFSLFTESDMLFINFCSFCCFLFYLLNNVFIFFLSDHPVVKFQPETSVRSRLYTHSYLPVYLSPSEKGSTLNGKNLLPRRPLSRRETKTIWQRSLCPKFFCFFFLLFFFFRRKLGHHPKIITKYYLIIPTWQLAPLIISLDHLEPRWS